MVINFEGALTEAPFQGKQALYATFATPDGPVKLAFPTGFSLPGFMEKVKVTAQVKTRVYQANTGLSVVSAKIDPTK